MQWSPYAPPTEFDPNRELTSDVPILDVLTDIAPVIAPVKHAAKAYGKFENGDIPGGLSSSIMSALMMLPGGGLVKGAGTLGKAISEAPTIGAKGVGQALGQFAKGNAGNAAKMLGAASTMGQQSREPLVSARFNTPSGRNESEGIHPLVSFASQRPEGDRYTPLYPGAVRPTGPQRQRQDNYIEFSDNKYYPSPAERLR